MDCTSVCRALDQVRKPGGPRLRAKRLRMLNAVSASPRMEMARTGQPRIAVAAYTAPSTSARALIPRVIACKTAKPSIAKAMNRLAANAPESTPKRSGKKDPTMAAASRPELDVGRFKADKSGHGRLSRPEIFTIRAASQRLNRFVTVENTAAAGG